MTDEERDAGILKWREQFKDKSKILIEICCSKMEEMFVVACHGGC